MNDNDDQTSSEPSSEPLISASTKRTPIPKFQLFILLLIQFAEPVTALVIYPFVVQFVRDTGITGGDEARTGFYAGLLESSFFVAEGLAVYQVGRLSDIYGRRPVLLLGPLGLALAMLGFGLSQTFWMLLGFRCMQGAFNGNIGVAKTVMSEISDPSNAADVFSFIQLMWSVGATTSPFMGGVLANAATKWPDTLGKIKVLRTHPYFLPCAAAACIAFGSFAFAFVGLRETLPSAVARAQKRQREAETERSPLLPRDETTTDTGQLDVVVPTLRALLTRPVCIAVLNHGMFCFCDMAYSSLVPLVYATPIALGGLGLKPYDIGRIMGLCGIFNAIVQVFLGGRVIRYFGPRRIFTAAFCALALMFSAYPLLNILALRAGRVDAAVIAVLVGQLSCSCVLYFGYAATTLFIMDSAPTRTTVGSVNGLAQMASTIVRSVAPSIASSFFALSVEHNLAGGYLVYVLLIVVTCGA
ncbi:MFS domain-containing protein [Mycena venus]|uniref:MFS domain-containing protein n=1 Tax=Mycena venus TaxID=2733690 RepID=A0A8H7D3W0_9AGAR|nr:MFS domain-containing protein [Mycena venus]